LEATGYNYVGIENGYMYWTFNFEISGCSWTGGSWSPRDSVILVRKITGTLNGHMLFGGDIPRYAVRVKISFYYSMQGNQRIITHYNGTVFINTQYLASL